MHTNPAPNVRTSSRGARPAGAICLVSGTLALATLAPGVASAAVLGRVNVSPAAGTDSTLFSGVIDNARCPAGTTDSYFFIVGADIGANGTGFLGQGTTTGQGRQEFVGASIANLKSTNTGSFSASGAYRIQYSCFGTSSVTDIYETTLNYVAGGTGAFTIQAAPPVPSPPASPAASPVVSPPASPAASPVVSPPASPAASPVVSPSSTGVAFGGGGAGAGGGGGLPTTGVETGLVLALGTGLLAAGAGLLRVGRRRVAGAGADTTVETA